MPAEPFPLIQAQPVPLDGNYLQALVNWQIAVAGSALQVQLRQLELMTDWQRSFGALQRELTDQWICRFGGGVPLDG